MDKKSPSRLRAGLFALYLWNISGKNKKTLRHTAASGYIVLIIYNLETNQAEP